MQRDSALYIVGFCAAVCLVCSVLVSSAAVGLKPLQEKNQLLDRQRKVLAVSGLLEEGKGTDAEVQALFAARIKPLVVDLSSGEAVEGVSAATFDQQRAKKDPATSRQTEKNPAGVSRVPNRGLVYLVSSTDIEEGFALEQYIFPVEGKGLWSTLYGYLALAPNGNVIRGLTFYQHGETPGLGGEVDNPAWKAKWEGRLAFGPRGIAAAELTDPKIEVLKGPAGPVETHPHAVDGLSGATITSKGVSHLVRFWLGPQGFGPFIQRAAAEAAS